MLIENDYVFCFSLYINIVRKQALKMDAWTVIIEFDVTIFLIVVTISLWYYYCGNGCFPEKLFPYFVAQIFFLELPCIYYNRRPVEWWDFSLLNCSKLHTATIIAQWSTIHNSDVGTQKRINCNKRMIESPFRKNIFYKRGKVFLCGCKFCSDNMENKNSCLVNLAEGIFFFRTIF